MKSKTFSRRNFIGKSSLGLMAAGIGITNYPYPTLESGPGQSQIKITDYRILGRTGFKVSDIGCGPVMITNENLLKTVIDLG